MIAVLLHKFWRDAALVAGAGSVLACVPLMTLLPGIARRSDSTLAEAVVGFAGLVVLPLVAALCALAVSRTGAPEQDALLARFPVGRVAVFFLRHAVGIGVLLAVALVFAAACRVLPLLGIPDRLWKAAAAIVSTAYALAAFGGCFGRRGRAVLIGLGVGAGLAGAVYWTWRELWWRGPQVPLYSGVIAVAAVATGIAASEFLGEPLGRWRALRVALAMAAIVLGGSAAGAGYLMFDDRRLHPGDGPTSDPSPAGAGTLVFTSGDWSHATWLYDRDGHRTVFSPGIILHAWHPTRDVLALVRYTNDEESRIEWRDASGRGIAPSRRIEDGAPLAWSMRWYGDRLLVQAYVGKGEGAYYVFDGPGSVPRRLPVRSTNRFAPLSSMPGGGERVALLHTNDVDGRSTQIVAVDLETGSVREHARLPFRWGLDYRAGAWSPDGQNFATWTRTRGSGLEDNRLEIVNMDGTRLTLSSAAAYADRGPAWLDDVTVAWGERDGDRVCAMRGSLGSADVRRLRCWTGCRFLSFGVAIDRRSLLVRRSCPGDERSSIYDVAAQTMTDLPAGYQYDWAGPHRLMRWKPGARSLEFVDQF